MAATHRNIELIGAPVDVGVATTVPGGATFREAHLVMEMLCDSGLVTSLDLVELNPFLDDRGKSAHHGRADGQSVRPPHFRSPDPGHIAI